MLKGSLVALVTPMLPDSTIDYQNYAELIEFHIREKTDGLVIAGTTGESATLSMQEHCDVLGFAVKQGNGRIPIIAGTGSNSTWEAIALTQSAADIGVDACLLVTPYYNKPTQQGLIAHYRAIARINIPQLLYNVPSRTACDLLPETVISLATEKNIIGIKEATGDLQRLTDIKKGLQDTFLLFSGDDITSMEFMLAGGDGVISVTSNIAPGMMHKMCIAAIKGDRDNASQYNNKLLGLHQALFVEANPIPVKWLLHHMGKIDSGLRLPLTSLSQQYHQLLAEQIENLGE